MKTYTVELHDISQGQKPVRRLVVAGITDKALAEHIFRVIEPGFGPTGGAFSGPLLDGREGHVVGVYSNTGFGLKAVIFESDLTYADLAYKTKAEQRQADRDEHNARNGRRF